MSEEEEWIIRKAVDLAIIKASKVPTDIKTIEIGWVSVRLYDQRPTDSALTSNYLIKPVVTVTFK